MDYQEPMACELPLETSLLVLLTPSIFEPKAAMFVRKGNNVKHEARGLESAHLENVKEDINFRLLSVFSYILQTFYWKRRLPFAIMQH